MDRRESRPLIERLNRDAERIGRRYQLRYRSIQAERVNVKSRYGICYEDGSIRIRLRHSVTGRPLKYSSLVNTLCHELAHLRYFNHGPRFKAFYFELLDFARAEGIYCPRQPGPRATPQALPESRPEAQRREPAGPIQLVLF